MGGDGSGVTIILEGERPPSWNKLYEQKHWATRLEMVNRIHAIVRSVIDPDVDPFLVPVAVTLTAYFDKNPMDPDNIPAKIYLDGIRPWIILDDSPRYVHSVTTASRVDRKRPRVEIAIIPA